MKKLLLIILLFLTLAITPSEALAQGMMSLSGSNRKYYSSDEKNKGEKTCLSNWFQRESGEIYYWRIN